ncbi:transcriptional adapter 2-alpha [Anaeramoeba flamelloides]|uniref:Transcriptional adapter 2-alpha n=1 Tax=Anaeramoeba flamelloides TaxID=1746091 RepID=A0ABQ8XDY8_9EUKA|nr:transcriptional adapter 2-alpha [Anaeramoeba flamelloides]
MDKSHHFYCNYCSSNITNSTIIICACCEDVILCTDCFSKGVEFGCHKKAHGYKVIVCDQQSVFQEDWSVEEETRLFEAIDQLGFQNWKDISFLVGSKSGCECKSHYEKVFLNSPNYEQLKPKLLPPHKNTNTTNNQNKFNRRRRNRKRMLKKRNRNQNGIFPAPGNELHSDPQENSKFKIYTDKKKTTISEKLGYIAKRNEFEIESNNDCEEMLDQMGIIDNTLSWDLKNEVLKGYNQKLEEREKKKQFVISMGLIYPLRSKQQKQNPLKQIQVNTNTKPNTTTTTPNINIETNTNKNILGKKKRRIRRKRKRKRRTKEQKQIKTSSKQKRQFQKRMRVFAKCFDKRSDYESSCDSLYQEYKLQSEIKLLLQLQNNISTLPQSQISMKPNKRSSARKLVEMNSPQALNSKAKSESLNNKKQIQNKMKLVETGHSPRSDIISPILYREDQILFEKN